MKADGRCHCGFIAYEAKVDPDSVDICNCIDCQTLSGSAFRVVVRAMAGSFRLLPGEPSIYVKVADSVNRRILVFRPRCATPINSAPADGKPGHVYLRTGAISQRRKLIPRAQHWLRSALSWVDKIGDLPKSETQ